MRNLHISWMVFKELVMNSTIKTLNRIIMWTKVMMWNLHVQEAKTSVFRHSGLELDTFKHV